MIGRAALLLSVASLAACGEDALLDTSRWEARQARIDPPMLWRVEALDGGAGSGPVQVCADSAMMAGFAQPMPEFDGRKCVPIDEPLQDGTGRTLVCETAGRRFAVASKAAGDLARAYTVRVSVRPLRSGAGGYTQTRRYERLGRCPDGWRVGEHTDQQGRRRAESRF